LAKDIVVATEREVLDLADVAGTVIRPALHEGMTIYAAV
jgi:hypothetical protein